VKREALRIPVDPINPSREWLYLHSWRSIKNHLLNIRQPLTTRDLGTDLRYHHPVRHPGLLNDILFKIVFGSQQSEPVLRALLNALLCLEGDQAIVELEILNPTFDKVYLGEKGAILDVKARDGNGRQFNIEVQLNPGVGDYKARSLYYTARFFCDQLERGDSYDLLKKTVSISILDFILFEGEEHKESIHSTFRLWERTRGES
jgi:hypothetical protein